MDAKIHRQSSTQIEFVFRDQDLIHGSIIIPENTSVPLIVMALCYQPNVTHLDKCSTEKLDFYVMTRDGSRFNQSELGHLLSRYCLKLEQVQSHLVRSQVGSTNCSHLLASSVNSTSILVADIDINIPSEISANTTIKPTVVEVKPLT